MIKDVSVAPYKASVACVIPASARDIWKAYDRCYMGVSLETDAFTPPKLDAVVAWVAGHFERCVVLVGDGLHRLTLQVTKDLSPDRAGEEARMIGDVFIDQNRPLFKQWPECRFEILRCSEIQRSSVYEHNYSTLSEVFRVDERFAASIRTSAASFISRRRRGKNDSDSFRDKLLSISCQYVLEEMAIFSCLVKSGWQVEVYPGDELPVLVEIAEGQYEGVPQELRSRVNIALKVRRLPQEGLT